MQDDVYISRIDNLQEFKSLHLFDELFFYYNERLVDKSVLMNFIIKYKSQRYINKMLQHRRLYNFIREIYRIVFLFASSSARLKEARLKNILQTAKISKITNVLWPFNYSHLVTGLCVSELHVYDSANYPIRLTFHSEARNLSLIYKYGDDLTNDMFVLEMIRFLSNMLGIDVVHYRVIPLSRTDGLIECVDCIDQSLTQRHLNSIIYGSKSTLANFIESFSFFLTVAYIFGVGDRNLDNIVFTDSGSVFYIDYAYLFGDDPKFYFDFFIPSEIDRIIDESIYDAILKNIIKNIVKARNEYGTIAATIEGVLKKDMYMFKLNWVLKYVSARLFMDLDDSRASCMIENIFLKNIKSYKATFISVLNKIGKMMRK